MTRESEFSDATKKTALRRSGLKCEAVNAGVRCNMPLRPGAVEFDHDKPLALGGDSSLGNCKCLCPLHHTIKTSTIDVPRIRAADRDQASIYGVKVRKGRTFPRQDRERHELTKVYPRRNIFCEEA